MLEIYNEDIRDLLSRKKDDGKKHNVRPALTTGQGGDAAGAC